MPMDREYHGRVNGRTKIAIVDTLNYSRDTFAVDGMKRRHPHCDFESITYDPYSASQPEKQVFSSVKEIETYLLNPEHAIDGVLTGATYKLEPYGYQLCEALKAASLPAAIQIGGVPTDEEREAAKALGAVSIYERADKDAARNAMLALEKKVAEQRGLTI